jgi:hypothetical protein
MDIEYSGGLKMLSVIFKDDMILFKDIVKGKLIGTIPFTTETSLMIDIIKGYDVISLDGKVYDNPLTRDK